MPADVFSQTGFRCKLEWGWRGAREAAARGDILVVVDTLRFSSAVVTAVQQGGLIYPCASSEDHAALARSLGAEAAATATVAGRFSLSPLTYLDMGPGTRVVLPSPNGATCSRYAAATPHLFVGALLNAGAVAAAVAAVLDATDLAVTVLACGERWQTPSEDGELRFALEDYLGAGAILSELPHEKSPEALACAGAFRQRRSDLAAILWECGSGRELQAKGHGEDVRHAARWNLYEAVPVMREGWLRQRGASAAN
ncbi:MAG TPA: 2-phosphosulfolactate phosphatase [Chthonomonadaceae bacterium]|nr:2-phosphosulfolactate phosphatase [Chthonomonadaceae bacterium]